MQDALKAPLAVPRGVRGMAGRSVLRTSSTLRGCLQGGDMRCLLWGSQ